MKNREILESLITQCDCPRCNYEWSWWFTQTQVIGKFIKDAYHGSHLEGKPYMYAMIEIGDFKDLTKTETEELEK